MTPESPLYPEQVPDPSLLNRLRDATAEFRTKAGRAAAASLLIAGSVVGVTTGEAVHLPIAHADTLDYPYPSDAEAPCYPPSVVTDSQGHYVRCSGYDWRVPTRDASGNITGWPVWTGRGYGARNCTDYVAWKLELLGVPANKVQGLQNGGQWYENAPTSERSTTPKAWDAAVVFGNPGHVAFIEGVHQDGTITISEYNHDVQGHGDTRTDTPANLKIGGYVDFGVHPADTPPPPPPDTDHDGINDPDDQCPTVPGIPALYGCPAKDIDGDGIADLAIINTINTGSGVTEAHELAGSGGYVNWLGHQATAVGYLDSTQQTLMADVNADNRPDLVVVNTANTGSGHVEVHVMDGTTGFSTWLEHDVTPLTSLDSTQKLAMGDVNGDGRADLLVINTANTSSGKVEVHALDAATHYSSWIGHWVTPADYLSSNSQVLAGDINGDGHPDVLIVNTNNTGSGMTEVHVLDGATNFSTWKEHDVTPVGYLDATQRLVVGDVNADKMADLAIVNTQNTGSGHVEVHPLSGATHFSAWLGHYIVTPLSTLDSTQRLAMGG